RISELRLFDEDATKISTRGLRFLAQPDHSYRIYLDPDRYVKRDTSEAGNLALDEDVLTIEPVPTEQNPGYIRADVDGDGVPDILDNCVSVENSDQTDVDGNERGDVCDDFDKDGLVNSKDNCPNEPNRRQIDTDADGLGDVCDDEESRLTEKYKWIPWVGIGFATLVILILFAITARSMIGKPKDDIDMGDTPTEQDN
ncbi:MAG: thrombospondin type 3 repeat-containing protein, partial [Anaerolineales bacterium]|nr:thrombospondin type 3 repeat-containing protein [Anaerolineales bacterium]